MCLFDDELRQQKSSLRLVSPVKNTSSSVTSSAADADSSNVRTRRVRFNDGHLTSTLSTYSCNMSNSSSSSSSSTCSSCCSPVEPLASLSHVGQLSVRRLLHAYQFCYIRGLEMCPLKILYEFIIFRYKQVIIKLFKTYNMNTVKTCEL